MAWVRDDKYIYSTHKHHTSLPRRSVLCVQVAAPVLFESWCHLWSRSVECVFVNAAGFVVPLLCRLDCDFGYRLFQVLKVCHRAVAGTCATTSYSFSPMAAQLLMDIPWGASSCPVLTAAPWGCTGKEQAEIRLVQSSVGLCSVSRTSLQQILILVLQLGCTYYTGSAE